jgi:hypothetical protein
MIENVCFFLLCFFVLWASLKVSLPYVVLILRACSKSPIKGIPGYRYISPARHSRQKRPNADVPQAIGHGLCRVGCWLRLGPLAIARAWTGFRCRDDSWWLDEEIGIR